MEHDQDQEALFHSYPCAYYVQSPSTLSHANSADIRNCTIPESEFHSPTRPDPTNPTLHEEASRFTLSHYSSSRGSSHSFLHQKKISYDAGSHGTETENGENRLIIVKGGGCGDDDDDDGGDEDDDEEYYYGVRKRPRWWKRYCSYRNSDSCVWICMQISWRALLSLWVALMVFYVATKPQPPKVSIKVAGIGQFVLAEGVDGSGVATKILTCNCSLNLVIENKSKLFGLHIHPPTMQMLYGRLPFALSHGTKLYAESGSSKFKLYIGTRNKPMYGAGRSMEDMLESGKGLSLVLRVRLRSSFQMVGKLIKPKFHHQAECLLILRRSFKNERHIQTYNSTCIMI